MADDTGSQIWLRVGHHGESLFITTADLLPVALYNLPTLLFLALHPLSLIDVRLWPPHRTKTTNPSGR